MTFSWLLVTSLALSSPSFVDDPVEFKKDFERIEKQITDAKNHAKKGDLVAAELSVKEIKLAIDELVIEAELKDTHPSIVRLRESIKPILSDAKENEKKIVKPKNDMMQGGMSMMSPPETKERIKIAVDMNKVSFKKDVAPIVANVCMRCHNATQKSGDYDASTFRGFVSQITPGKPDDSHVLKLVTGKAEPRMPRGGMTRFSREWVDIWTAWIRQGAKFDGTSDSAPISSYLIDLDSQRRDAIAKMSGAELEKLHREESSRQIGLLKLKTGSQFRETKNLIVFTTTGESDLEYIATLGEAVFEDLQTHFRSSAKNATWPGKLGLYVFSDRVDFLAFAQMVDGVSPEPEEYGHMRMGLEHQYVAVCNSHQGRDLDEIVAEFVTRAYLGRLGDRKLPPWANYGYSRLVAGTFAPKSTVMRKELASASQWLVTAKNGDGLFKEQLPWIELAPLSTSFFHYLSKTEKRKTSDFVAAYAKTGNFESSLNSALRMSPNQAFQGWVASTKVPTKTKQGTKRK